MTLSFFTIGHSTRSTAEFVDLLRASRVELVVDVRHMPRSRSNQQFDRERLPKELHRFQIGYVHLAALGGLRNRPREIETSPNLFWENLSFRNYADYALTEEFLTDEVREGLRRHFDEVIEKRNFAWQQHRGRLEPEMSSAERKREHARKRQRKKRLRECGASETLLRTGHGSRPCRPRRARRPDESRHAVITPFF
jgi:hypothetical protein